MPCLILLPLICSELAVRSGTIFKFASRNGTEHGLARHVLCKGW